MNDANTLNLRPQDYIAFNG